MPLIKYAKHEKRGSSYSAVKLEGSGKPWYAFIKLLEKGKGIVEVGNTEKGEWTALTLISNPYNMKEKALKYYYPDYSSSSIMIGNIPADMNGTLELRFIVEGYQQNILTVKGENGTFKVISQVLPKPPVQKVTVNFLYMDGTEVADSIQIDKASQLTAEQLPAIKGDAVSHLWFEESTVKTNGEWNDSIHDDSKAFRFETDINNDLTLVVRRTFAVTFQKDQDNLEKVHVNENSTVSVPSSVADWKDSDGETLQMVWKNNDQTFDFHSKITGNIVLTAVQKDKVTVSFLIDDQVVAEKRVYPGSKVILPEDLKDKADQWVTGTEQTIFDFENTEITENLTIVGIKNPVTPGDNDAQKPEVPNNDNETDNNPQEDQNDNPNKPQQESPNGNDAQGQDQASEKQEEIPTVVIIEPLPLPTEEEQPTKDEAKADKNIEIADDTTPLSGTTQVKAEAFITDVKEISIKDIRTKGGTKLIKSYHNLSKKLQSEKRTEKEVEDLYKKLQDNKKKYHKDDYQVIKLKKGLFNSAARKNLWNLIQVLNEYKMADYSEKTFSNLFKKYIDAVNALNNKKLSDKKITAIYKSLLQEKKIADQSRKSSK